MHRYAYVGTYTRAAPGGASPGAQSRGVHIYDTDAEPWREVACLPAANPSFLALHPHLDVLYAVSEVDEHAGQPTGAILGWRLGDLSAPLFRLALPPGACGPAHIATHDIYIGHRWQRCTFYNRAALSVGWRIAGPAVIIDSAGTTLVEPAGTGPKYTGTAAFSDMAEETLGACSSG